MANVNALAMGFPTDFFPVLFAIPRLVGWLAHWREAMLEGRDGPTPRIWRPRQVYVGHRNRIFIPIEKRTSVIDDENETKASTLEIPQNLHYRRYLMSSSRI